MVLVSVDEVLVVQVESFVGGSNGEYGSRVTDVGNEYIILGDKEGSDRSGFVHENSGVGLYVL